MISPEALRAARLESIEHIPTVLARFDDRGGMEDEIANPPEEMAGVYAGWARLSSGLDGVCRWSRLALHVERYGERTDAEAMEDARTAEEIAQAEALAVEDGGAPERVTYRAPDARCNLMSICMLSPPRSVGPLGAGTECEMVNRLTRGPGSAARDALLTLIEHAPAIAGDAARLYMLRRILPLGDGDFA